MGRRKRDVKALPTIWRVPDRLWERVQPVIGELDPPAPTGRRRVDPRKVLDALIFRMRTGCQWNQLPKVFGDDSSIHRTFQRWLERGALDAIWVTLVDESEELGGVEWQWQAADTAMGRAFFGGTRLGRTPRIAGKTG
jgi:putative transposase